MAEIEMTPKRGVKSWEEMTDAERISVLQRELIRTQDVLKRLSNYVSKLIDHDHLNGRMITRLGNPNEESYGGIYFEPFDPNKVRV